MKGMGIAHGLRGYDIKALGACALLDLLDYLACTGLVSDQERTEGHQSWLALYRVIGRAWSIYRDELGSIRLYPELDHED